MYPVQVLPVNLRLSLKIAKDNEESKIEGIFIGSEHPKPLIFLYTTIYKHNHFKLCVHTYFHAIMLL